MPNGITTVLKEALLTYEEMELICRAAASEGVRKLKITGGEPLVRLGCAALIGRLKKIPGIRQVTMTTNGIVLERYLPELLDNGLDAVNISLDTLDPQIYQTITGTDALASVWAGMQRAVDAGLKVKINCVLLKGINDGEWKRMAALTLDYPLDVRFIEMMPIGYGKEYETISNEKLLEALKKSYPVLETDRRIHGNGPAVYYKIPGAKGSVGLISAMHGKFCESCNRLRLTSQGKIKPCLCFAQSVDLLPVLRNPGLDLPVRESEVRRLLRQAVAMKPQQHRFEDMEEVTEASQMVQIGG